MTSWHPPTLYEERLRPSGRAWWWLLTIVVITFFTLGLVVVPIAIAAWFVNYGRFFRTTIRIDSERFWVGRRSVRLAALDLSTVGRATNPRPWRVFSSCYLGGNPIWTRDSIGVKGRDGTHKCWIAVGTNRRDELVATLSAATTAACERVTAAAAAYAGQPLAPPGWYGDPDDSDRVRWWDGTRWTDYGAPRPEARA